MEDETVTIRKLLKHRLFRIGTRGVTVGGCLAGLVTVSTLAWIAYVISTWSFTGTAGANPVPLYVWEAPDFFQDASAVGDNSGVYVKNALSPTQGVSGSVTNITDNGVSYASAMLRNLDVVPIYACGDLSAVPAWAQVSKTDGQGGGLPKFGPFGAGTTNEVAIYIRHAGLVPDQDMTLAVPFQISKTACP